MDKNIEFIESLGKIIVFLMLLFSVFLITAKSNRKLSNQIFAAFLIITAFDFAGLFLGEILVKYSNIQILKTSSSLLQMPLFYFYVLSLCYSDFKLKPKYIIHTLLFLLFVIIFKTQILAYNSIFIFTIISEIQYFAYIIAIFLTLNRYKKVYLENYSDNKNLTSRWIFQITTIFCIAHIFVLLKIGISQFSNSQHFLQYIYILISISSLVIICWFVLKALNNPRLFTGIKINLTPIASYVENTDIKNKKDEFYSESITQLKTYMAENKPYLDFDLTLQKLADQVQIQEKELSLLINHQLGMHFFDFINEYRIEEAKVLLKEKSEFTVLEILYQVGFNSKSSFYTAFKKKTTQTPTEYRKSIH